jgi:hypothetical protein
MRRESQFVDEGLLEPGIFVERHMMDPVSEPGITRIGLEEIEQRDFGSQQSGVTGWMDSIRREWKQADGMGTGATDVIPEGTGQEDPCQILRFCSPLLQKEFESGTNGSFGELKLANIGLSQNDRVEERERTDLAKASLGGDVTEGKAGGDGIDQAAAADPSRFNLPEHVAVELVIEDLNGADCSGGGAHPMTDAGAFEGGTRGSGSAQDMVAIAQDDFAVGAEIDESNQPFTFVELGGEDSREQIAADKPSQGGQEPDSCIAGQFPGKRCGGEGLKVEGDRSKGTAAQRFDIKPAKEMVHECVADDHDLFGHVAEGMNRAEEFGNQITDLPADEAGQGTLFARLTGKLDSAHDIGAILRLPIESRANTENAAGTQIKQLSDDGSGAEIDGDAQSRLWCEWES